MDKLKRPAWVPSLLLAALVWLVYSNSLHSPFHLDDFHVIPENPAVRGPSDIPQFFVDTTTFSILPGNRDYRPVFLTAAALSWWAGGGAMLPFHLVSVTLHMTAVLLLFSILRRFANTRVPPLDRVPARHAEQGAVVGAAIFALHPLASQPVNYIAAQSVLWAAVFYLLAFRLFLSVWDPIAVTTGAKAWWRQAGSWTAYVLALLSKPIAITLPLILVLWDVIINRTEWHRESWGRRIARHFPFLVITFGYLGLRHLVVEQAFSVDRTVRPLFDHYLTQTKALVVYYGRLALWPTGQSLDRDYPVSSSILEPAVLISFCVIIVIGAALLWFRRARMVAFWVLWFPAALFVTTYLVVLFQVVNEHRVYISLAGVCGLAGVLVARALGSDEHGAGGPVTTPFGRSFVVRSVVLVVLIACALATRERNRIWSSDFTLWENAATDQGTWRAHMNYGLALQREGRHDEAFAAFKRAESMDSIAYTNMNLGLAYLRRNETEKGLEYLRRAVALWPSLPEAHLFLAYGLERSGDLVGAEKELLKSLELRPEYLNGMRRLARFYERTGRHLDAAHWYRRLLEVDAGQVGISEALDGLEQSTPEKQRLAQAVQLVIDRQFEQGAALLAELEAEDPDNPSILFSLGYALQKLGRSDDAIERYRQLLRIDPGHIKGTFNLAYALLHEDQPEGWDESAQLFSRVLDLDPGYWEAAFHCASAHRKVGQITEAERYDRLYLENGPHAELRERSRKRLNPNSTSVE